MLELLALEQIIADEDSYLLQIRIPKSLYSLYKSIFYNFEAVAQELSYKERLANMRSKEAVERRELTIRQRDDTIKADMKQVYLMELEKGSSPKEAMMIVNRRFKDYLWIRRKFQAELKIQKEFEVVRLSRQGLTSVQIGDKIGLHPGTCRKIISKFKEAA